MPPFNTFNISADNGYLYFTSKHKDGNPYYVKFDGLKDVKIESTVDYDGFGYGIADRKRTTITIDSDNIEIIMKEKETKEEIKEEEIIQLMEGEML